MCSKPGCDKPIRARGFCINHYGAATLEARKEAGYVPADRRKTLTENDLEDFWQFVKKEIGFV